MKKNVVALGVAALVSGFGMVGAANAGVIAPSGTFGDTAGTAAATELRIASNGVGHILMVPYFTAQGGNKTLLNIVNTDTVHGKAVKVRFRGASNSDDVLDFTLFMSPGDVWTGEVSTANDDGAGVAVLRTTDNSCTLPFSVRSANGQVSQSSFITSRLNPNATVEAREAGTREGYIEILTMADIVPNTATRGLPVFGVGAINGTNFGTTDAPVSFFNVTKHNSAGNVTCGDGLTGAALDTFIAALEADITTELAAENLRLAPATSGLTANWAIARINEGLSFSDRATAVVATTAGGVAGQANFVMFPQTAAAAPTPTSFSADPLFAGAPAPLTAAMFDLPDLSTPYTATPSAAAALAQAAALSGAIATTSVSNEYSTTTLAQFRTDWVFSMPTRRYFVAVNYTGADPLPGTTTRRPTAVQNVVGQTLLNGATGAGDAGDSLGANTFFRTTAVATTGANVALTATANASLVGDQLCVRVGDPVVYDRSERTQARNAGFVISPGAPADPLRFCGEVSVIAFNNGSAAASGVLGATVALNNLNTSFTDGWARIPVASAATDVSVADDNAVNRGLPILGHAFLRAAGGNTPGVNANFGLTFPHRTVAP